MKKLLTGLMLLTSIAAFASDGVFLNFATCTSSIEEIPVTLDFFEEYDATTQELTGNGYVMQNSGDMMKTLNKITIVTDKDKEVSMFTTIDPSMLFAKFTIDMQKESEVDIFALNFGQIWAKFKCTPQMTDI